MADGALVFNIQKFCLHDGPGIRTTVFMKGCPLRCRWCANPESQRPGAQPLFDREKCLRCGRCAANCASGAVHWTDEGPRFDESRCAGCGRCAAECPGGALEVQGRAESVEAVLRACLRDAPFYEESGGGVTLSGGEPLMHPEFALKLLEALKREGIHTALETTGCAPQDVFDRVTARADLLLFDVKHPDGARHRWGTGVDNALILSNLRRAIASGRDVLPRIPVIPGFNDGADDVRGFADVLTDAGARRAQLLPFHQLGEKKYALLGRAYAMSGVRPLHAEDLAEFQRALRDAGIDCFI